MEVKPIKKKTGRVSTTTINSFSDSLKLYDDLVAEFPGIKRQGVKNAYTLYKGIKFTHLTNNGVLYISLPDEERKLFMKKYKDQFIGPLGNIKKGFVRIPESLLKNTNELKVYFKMSYDYVNSKYKK